MKIVDFINEFKTSAMRSKLISDHIKTRYMNWLLKVGEAENIVQKSCYQEDKFRLNSPLRYYLYIITIIRTYTDLEFDNDNIMNDFNLLEENGATEFIIQEIGEDVGRFNTVLKMTLDDHMENYRSLVSYIDEKSNALMDVLATMEVDQNGER